MPKAELHVHIEAIATSNSIDYLLNKYKIGKEKKEILKNSTSNIQEFFAKWHFLNSLLKQEEDFELVTYEYLKESALIGVKYVEININIFRQLDKGLNLEKLLTAVNKSIKKCRETYGIFSNVIFSYSRAYEKDRAFQVLDLIQKFKNQSVVGFDIAGDENSSPNQNYLEVFKEAKRRNINTYAHAGEGAGVDSITSLFVDSNIKRIGHGVDSSKDEKCIQTLKIKR